MNASFLNDMKQFTVLPPIDQMSFISEELISIKRNDLVPLLDNQTRLNLYADQLIQAQSVLLSGIDTNLTQKLNQIIVKIIEQLSSSKKKLDQRKFNALQKWLGLDLEFSAGQVKYMYDLNYLIDEAKQLSRRLHIEIQKSESRFQQATGLRTQMAKHIRAAEEFLYEYPSFVQNRHPLDNFADRLSKKINSLQTLQTSNDIALAQMQLTQQLSLALLDRFNEAQQVLIPAWQYHLKQSSAQNSLKSTEDLDKSRDKLIQSLKKSLENK